MNRRRVSQPLPADLRRELVELFVMHVRRDGSWEGKDLAGETHQLSEVARGYVLDVLARLLDGKRPYLPDASTSKRKRSADERYVALINKALDDGASTMNEAYVFSADAGGPLAPDERHARIREAKRAWTRHWEERSRALGPGHRLSKVPAKEMSNWVLQRGPESPKAQKKRRNP